MKIDAHIHFTPPSMAEHLDEFSEREPLWGLMIAPRERRKSIQGWASAERMIEDMDRAGIDRVIIQGIYRQSLEGCIEENDKMLEVMRKYPGRVYGYCMLYPLAGEKNIDELQRCLDQGMLGVGELNPYAQGFKLDGSEFRILAEKCSALEVPVSFHTNEEIGHFYLGKSTTPLRNYYTLALLYPELKIILAHWGGGLFFYEIMPEVRRAMKNVWYDMAASPLLFPTRKILTIALECISHRKILFGSDYPLLIYPGKIHEPEFNMFLKEIESLNLSPQIFNDIMGCNIARLLRWMVDDIQERSEVNSYRPALQKSIDVLTSGQKINGNMSVRIVAESFPSTRPVFEKYGIPWNDSPVPIWEPIQQAAAARGWNSSAFNQIIKELNDSVESTL